MTKIIEENELQTLNTSINEEQNFLHDVSIINISSNTSDKQHNSIIPLEKSLKPKNEYHYELNLIPHPYDFLFDSLNYPPELFKESSSLQTMPHHLRDTLFIKNDRLKQLRKKSFSEIFIIAEEIKAKGNKLFIDEYYQEALNEYTKAYSLYKWIEFINKDKERKVLNNYIELTSNPIIDSDIRKRTCRIEKKTKHEEETFKFTMTMILKGMSSCYIKLLAYSEAIKCLNEALEYSDNTKPDIYYRRAQGRMYNKYSNRDKLGLAEKDFIEALKRRPGDSVIEEEFKELKALIKAKEENNINSIKKLISMVFYADSVIKRKGLESTQVYSKNYEINHLNYKIMKEMKQSYYTALRHFTKTENTIEYSKGIKEYEEFLDAFIKYKFYYELDVNRLGINYQFLNQTEIIQLEQIKHCESLLSLFNDFKYKKCDDIYLEINLNPRIWEKSYNIVAERDKLNSSINEMSRESYFESIKQKIKNWISNIPQGYLYFFICFFFVLSLIVFFPKLISFFT